MKKFHTLKSHFNKDFWNTNPAQCFSAWIPDEKEYRILATKSCIQPHDYHLFNELRGYYQTHWNSITNDHHDVDYFVYPNNYIGQPEAKNFVQHFREHFLSNGKTKLVFTCNHDFSNQGLTKFNEIRSEIPDSRVEFWHSNLSASQRKPYEFALPCFSMVQPSEDHKKSKDLNLRLSFCGSPYTHPVRLEIIKALWQNCTRIVPDFILRNDFHGHKSMQDKIAHSNEFADNMGRCTYALCIRGSGNFSYRFCEALRFGRVPVVIDTDNVLPLDDGFAAFYSNPKFVVRISMSDSDLYRPDRIVEIVESAIVHHHESYYDEGASIFNQIRLVGNVMTPMNFLRHFCGILHADETVESYVQR